MIMKRSAFLVMLCLPLMISADNFFDNNAGAIVTSPANARGVDNVDCSMSDVDAIATIESKVCVIDENVSAGLCQPTLIDSAPYTISSSGNYIVTTNLQVTSGPATVITIDADDVTLDLCGFTLSGDDDVTGIEIQADHENITIKNGVISGIDYIGSGLLDTGIEINGGVSRVIIDNVDIIDTEVVGLLIGSGATSGINDIVFKNSRIKNGALGISVGTSSATISGVVIDSVSINTFTSKAIGLTGTSGVEVLNSKIVNCIMTNCASGSTSEIIDLDHCDGCMVHDCRINNNVCSGIITLLNLDTCNACTVAGCEYNNNTGATGFIGVQLLSSTECAIKGCVLDSNIATTGTFEGYNLITSDNNIIEDCIARNNSGSGTVRGLSLASSSNNNIMRQCNTTSNNSTSGTTAGFYINSNSNMLIDCISNNNQGSTSGDGFEFGSTSELACIRCIAQNNETNGFYASAATLTDSEFKDCQALDNGTAGFDLTNADTTTRLFRNVACNNGTNYISAPTNAVITSAANAQGWDNIDCSDTTIDSEDEILTKVCAGFCQPTLITAADIPYTISTSGTYLVTENLSHTGSGVAITITADNVTLDMCGFTLSGPSSTASPAIFVPSGTNDHVVIKNGTVRSFQLALHVESGSDRTIKNMRFDDINVSGSGQIPFRFDTGADNTIFRDIVIRNSGVINAATSFTVSLVSFVASANITIENILFEGNSATFADYETTAGDQFNLLLVNTGCENVMINTIKMQGNESQGLLRAIYIIGSDNVSLSDFMVQDNKSGDGFGIGGTASNFVRITSSQSIAVKNGQISHNLTGTLGAAQATSTIIYSMSGCSGVSVSDILINNNNATGQITDFQLNNVDDVMVSNIQVSNNHNEQSVQTALSIASSRNVTMRDCLAANNTTDATVVHGFTISSSQRVVVENCQALNNGGASSSGFLITGALDDESELVMKNCVSDGHGLSGYRIARFGSASPNGPRGGVFINCIAQNNTGQGFRFNTGPTENAIFINCIAQNNTGAGFAPTGGAIVLNSIFKQCQALNNGADGFLINGASSVELKDCQAMFNTGNGFELDDTTITSLIMLKNAACNNTSTDYNFTGGGTPAGIVVVAPASSLSDWDNIDC